MFHQIRTIGEFGQKCLKMCFGRKFASKHGRNLLGFESFGEKIIEFGLHDVAISFLVLRFHDFSLVLQHTYYYVGSTFTCLNHNTAFDIDLIAVGTDG